MSKLHIVKVALIVRAKLPHYAFQQHVPGNIDGLGEQIAVQVSEYVKQQQLGYYPALEYFQNQAGVDDYLLDAVEQTSVLAVSMCKQEVKKILQPIFSTVQVGTCQSLAYTMPTIRPNQPHALKRLAEHFVPDRVKFELEVSLIQRHEPVEGIEKSAKQMVLRWLKDAFDELEVSSTRVIND